MARKYHGIISATYASTGGGSTAINNLVAEKCKATPREMVGPDDPHGGKFHGTRYWDVECGALDLTAYAAIEALWAADTLLDFVFTLDNSETLTFTAVRPQNMNPMEITGAVEGRADGFDMKVGGPASKTAFA